MSGRSFQPLGPHQEPLQQVRVGPGQGQQSTAHGARLGSHLHQRDCDRGGPETCGVSGLQGTNAVSDGGRAVARRGVHQQTKQSRLGGTSRLQQVRGIFLLIFKFKHGLAPCDLAVVICDVFSLHRGLHMFCCYVRIAACVRRTR